MQDYTKKHAAQAGQLNSDLPIQGKTNGIPNSALQDVFAGRRRADSSMMGHSQNLAPSIAAKMSRAFGMDLTGMQVYRSEAMAGTGMRGMAQGNKVVLSSDVNLNTMEGQAVFGHEVSHIRAQSQGIGTGRGGLYENAALEHQADTEGMLAAQGRSIYSGGMDTGIGMQYGLGMQGVEGLTSLSSGMSANAAAPMQAKKDDTMKVNTGLLPDPSKKGLVERLKGVGSGIAGGMKSFGSGIAGGMKSFGTKLEDYRMGVAKKRLGVSDEDFAELKAKQEAKGPKLKGFKRLQKSMGVLREKMKANTQLETADSLLGGAKIPDDLREDEDEDLR